MADSKKPSSRQLTLKRQVAIKAIVTDKFKKYLSLEIEENVKNAERRIAELEPALQNAAPTDPLAYQWSTEVQQHKSMIEQAPLQQKTVDELEVDSEYPQGLVDGFVTIAEGDNLYEKLAGVELTVKDGVVTSIAKVPLKGDPFKD